MSRVLKAALFCLLALAMLVWGGSVSADVRTCRYTIFAGGVDQNVAPALLGYTQTSAPFPVSAAQFSVKGRYQTECGIAPHCWFIEDDDYKTAQIHASWGAESCVKDAINQFGMPPTCSQRQSYLGSVTGQSSWSEVLDWRFPNLKQSAIDTVCARATARVDMVYILVRRQAGWSSRCDIDGNRNFMLWADNQGYCFSDRPLPSSESGRPLPPPPNVPPNPGTGRPVPADPTGGLPPPPSHGITAAPDLKVDKTAGQKTCLPHRSCKFKVRISNDGLGLFKGPLTVTDTITPASERLTRFGPAPWNCSGGNGSYSCRHPGIELHPGQSTELSLAFTNTEKARGTVENCASIDWEIPPLEGLCTAAIEEALARERKTMSADAKSETDKAVKEYQCRSGLKETGRPDTQLLRLAFKSLGMGDTNADNDTSCAASSIDLPEPETATLTPEDVQCTGGRFRSRSTGECLCPSNRPVWDGTNCKTRGRADKPPATRPPPLTTTPTPRCTGGWFWDPRVKGCRCPLSAPAWNGKNCYRRVTKPAPSPTTPYCSGGRFWYPKTRTCVCPPQTPAWDGKRCKPRQPAVTPGVTTPLCRGGMYWNKKTKACRCPSSKPVWNKYKARCEARSLTGPPTTTPTAPSTTSPPTTAPTTSGKIICRGGKMAGSLCWCGIGRFPKKVSKNVYQCQ